MININFDLSQLTVIIPTLNEKESIGLVLKELFEVGIPKNNIIIVDGRSTDGTDKIAKDLEVRIIYQDGKGKADAVKKGLSLADTKYAIVMDGDYTYPAKYIPYLLETAQRKNCVEVIGARVRGRENIPFINRIGNKIITEM
ncbi:MAG: glycosyltransferase family 2 protein, partial [Fervidicoccaceae archaeon]